MLTNSPNIVLRVDVSLPNPIPPNEIWTKVSVFIGTNESVYYYCYTGGDDGHGGIVVSKGKGANTAHLSLGSDRRFEIHNCSFSGDLNQQLKWNNGSKYAGEIVDKNTAVQNAYYSVNVIDTRNPNNPNCVISCDPGVINKPYTIKRA